MKLQFWKSRLGASFEQENKTQNDIDAVIPGLTDLLGRLNKHLEEHGINYRYSAQVRKIEAVHSSAFSSVHGGSCSTQERDLERGVEIIPTPTRNIDRFNALFQSKNKIPSYCIAEQPNCQQIFYIGERNNDKQRFRLKITSERCEESMGSFDVPKRFNMDGVNHFIRRIARNFSDAPVVPVEPKAEENEALNRQIS